MKNAQKAPNFAALIDDLGQSMSRGEIAATMGLSVLSDSMVRFYRLGAQPMYWRGVRLVEVWCATMGKAPDDLPMIDVMRGHRIGRREADYSPRVQRLPQWPATPQPAVKPTKGRRERA